MTDEPSTRALGPGRGGAPKAATPDLGGDGVPTAEDGAIEGRKDLPTWNRTRRKRGSGASDDAPSDDAFQTSVKQAARFSLSHVQLVLGGIAVVVIGIAAFAYYRSTSAERMAARGRDVLVAAAGETRAQIVPANAALKLETYPVPVAAYRDEGERDQAVAEALGRLEAAGDAESVRLAKLMRGAAAVRRGDHAAAEAFYDEFLASAGKTHPLRMLGVEGRLIAREAQGDLEGALADAEALVGNPGDYYRDMGLWHRGRVLEALGRDQDALATYHQYIEEYPLKQVSLGAEGVRKRLQALDPAALEADAQQREDSVEILDAAGGGEGASPGAR